jgi:hypothetical protein
MDISIPYYSDQSRVSNSSLGWFLQSPRYFRDMLDGKIKNEPTSAMENGTMTHTYLIQPKEFKETYKILDFAVPTSAQQKQFAQDYIDSKATSAILKAVEAFKSNYVTTKSTEEDIATKGLEMALKLKPYIKWLRSNSTGIKTMTWSKLNTLKTTKENVQLHKLANELLFKSDNSSGVEAYNEFHINWEITPIAERFRSDSEPRRKIACKSLIDRLIIDHDNKVIKLVDIKTTVSIPDFKDSFKKYDYGRQMAFYWAAIYWYFTNELKLNIEEYSNETYIVAIQNTNGDCKVFKVNDSTITDKTLQITKIITDIDWHMQNNVWDYSREYYEGDGSEPLPYDI